MASQAWQLESSLRRSARLGLEVLERASRRRVDWSSSVSPSPNTTSTDGNAGNEVLGNSAHTSLDDAFETIAEFMAQTTNQCKNFYTPETEPMENERTHVCKYHSQSHQRPGTTLQIRKHARSSPEDFHIEVSPGTYAITAGMQDSQQQTRLVRINAGESMNLTFHL
ncbi:A-kinase-interacting protein 1 [Coregonus clupeaformis]|uniref:A-kinase-interacting protein 1 n=1 Tax=Coregonus clupeaformis TaxID=59861 RepID=UPI001BDFF4AD|nr:A-kinase-interacting protein 1 [Coregonus clupeaformis]